MIKKIAISLINNNKLSKYFYKLFRLLLNNLSIYSIISFHILRKCKNDIEFSNDLFDQLKTDELTVFHPKIPFIIVKKEAGKGEEHDRFCYQKKFNNFSFKPGEKVLDVGAGHIPFPFATHLSDLFDEETTHRSEPLYKDERPFIKCNIENMPFSDKEFDFVFCSHVLEHIDKPASACKELIRIARRGYIETPTRTSDIMFNFTHLQNHHKWHIHILNKTLIFMEWKDSERRDLKSDFFYNQFQSIWKNPFQDIVNNNREMFVNMLMWENSFEYLVIDKYGKIVSNSQEE